MEIKIVCNECGEEMEYETKPMGPGFNGPVIEVTPCCMPEDKAEDYAAEKEEVGDLKILLGAVGDIVDEYRAKYK